MRDIGQALSFPIDVEHTAETPGARRQLRTLRPGQHVLVAVIGGGVAGLTAALELRACGVEVVIIEDRELGAITSWIAAGLVEPIAGTRDPDGLARELAAFTRSMQAWAILARSGSPLISQRQVFTYCSTARPPLPWRNAVDGFRRLSSEELHPMYAGGEAATFSTYVVETHDWLTYTRAQLASQGVEFIHHHVDDFAEVPRLVERRVHAIINASGLGAAKLANDPTVYRGDGHIIRLAPVAGVDAVFMDETRAKTIVDADPLAVNVRYIIPRRRDIIVGGTLFDRWDVTEDPQPKAEMPAHLLRLAIEVEPRLRDATILEYRVGSRPRRIDGVRVELDLAGDLPVAHYYGQGGSGWTLAPALAEEAVGLLADAVWARRAA